MSWLFAWGDQSTRGLNTFPAGLWPYHPERTQLHLISEAKQGRAWLVPGWENQLSVLVCLCDITSRGFPICILTRPLCWIQHSGLLVQWKCTTLASGEEAILSIALLPWKPQFYSLLKVSNKKISVFTSFHTVWASGQNLWVPAKAIPRRKFILRQAYLRKKEGKKIIQLINL